MDTNDTPTDDDVSSDELTIPTKDIDPSLAVDERLTDNVVHGVGPARYFRKDENGDPVEDWAGVFERVAQNVAEAEANWGDEDDVEQWADRFERMMRRQEFMPNSPTLMNADTPLQQLSACFVVEPGDAMTDAGDIDRSSICDAQSEASAIFKSGGGVGYAFHHLRPKGARVSSTGGVSSGPLSFMELFDETCNTVKQGGKRRGAQMAIMHSQHPDIGRFATAKRTEGDFSNFNISVGVSDEFKFAVENDIDYLLFDPTEGYVGDTEPFEVVPETKHFYDPQYEDAWNDELDKPGVDEDGNTVRENFWRDHLDDMQNPEVFEQYRDELSLEVGDEMWLPAGFIWQLIVDGAHANGEPGVFHFSETNRKHSFDVDEHPDHTIHATNPCGEQPLENYEACNLGHVNLSTIADPSGRTWQEFKHDEGVPFLGADGLERAVDKFLDEALKTDVLQRRVEWGTRFLDNVVTQSEFPIDEISEAVESKRKIGLGVMGFAQLLIQLGVEYGSEASYEIARELMTRIDSYATRASHELAIERGVFPEYEESKWAEPAEYPEWFEEHAHADPEDWKLGHSMRNHNVTTVAPTGTTSMIGDTSGGIEPIYNVAYFKNVGDDIQGDDMLVEFDDFFLRTLEANDIDVEAVKEEAETKMRNNEFDGVDDLDLVPDTLARVFVTAQDLAPEQHTRMQGAFQESIDAGLSKTINLPNEAELDDVGDALMLALDLGIKGATIYRDGSRQEQVNTTRVDNELDEGDALDGMETAELIDELEDRNIDIDVREKAKVQADD